MEKKTFKAFSEDDKTEIRIESLDFIKKQKDYYTMKSKSELTQLKAENERLKEQIKLFTEIIKGFGTNH